MLDFDRRTTCALALGACLTFSSACGGSSGGGGDGDGGEPTPPTPNLAAQVADGYARLLLASYQDVTALAMELEEAVQAFVAAPSAAGLEAAREAWLAARPYYQQTEMARFYDGPIDDPDDGPEGQLNAWPLDESYIDFVDGAPDAGIVNDPTSYPVIDADLIASLNEVGGEENIATGWHAIEFLLWGQDFDPAGPGDRPFTDYLVGDGASAPNGDRRAAYLAAAAELLVDDLEGLVDAWAPGADNFRARFDALAPTDALSAIMTGIGSLAFGELRGERIVVPFTTKLQEDEHSCFSDTTNRDHRDDVVGIRNVWRGAYASSDSSLDVSGTGLREWALTVSPELTAELDAILDELVALLDSPAIDPFDQAILGADTTPGRVVLQQSIDDLARFNDRFSALAAAGGIDIRTSLQD